MLRFFTLGVDFRLWRVNRAKFGPNRPKMAKIDEKYVFLRRKSAKIRSEHVEKPSRGARGTPAHFPVGIGLYSVRKQRESAKKPQKHVFFVDFRNFWPIWAKFGPIHPP